LQKYQMDDGVLAYKKTPGTNLSKERIEEIPERTKTRAGSLPGWAILSPPGKDFADVGPGMVGETHLT